VTGSRTLTDFGLVVTKLDLYCRELGKLVVVTGACPTGADALAEKWAFMRYHTVKRFHADWSLGKKAGPLRNAEMTAWVAEQESYAVAFWNGRSRGTFDCIARIRERKIPLKVVKFNAVSR
jgi:hypothetical protein